MKSANLAILIDGDNFPTAHISDALSKLETHGTCTVRRLYCDWTRDNASVWKKIVLKHGLQTIQQLAFSTGKNATDFAITIDAMDLMYSHKYDGICLLTSDSDFTPLVLRLRQNGLKVYGVGEHKAPLPLREACTQFITLPTPIRNESTPILPDTLTFNQQLKAAIIATSKDGWTTPAVLGQHLSQKLGKEYVAAQRKEHSVATLSKLLHKISPGYVEIELKAGTDTISRLRLKLTEASH
ncbi:NYN domain-containing protein [Asticcacaulis endophyticus]|uniref:NYN domain-containing protein n=1 Tax=Asticcacaulis endophyticus TaxID=1395890 RepID=A0A918UNG9_9CAUL|nr:NYN domain-containing protein [Asticcacaulis endophyticus]GGZ22713.1 hypothetical protein GCM10011273_04460 [Asticcacaulis endophyticus]